MATINRTFDVRNGISVANTIIVDSTRHVSNIISVNAVTVNATNFVTSEGLNVTNQANAAHAKANSAANTVRVSANSGSTLSGRQLNFANSMSVQVSVTDAGDGNANIVFTTTGAAVGDAYAQANAAYGQANAAYDEANTRVLRTGDTMTGALIVQANVSADGFLSTKTTTQAPSTSNFNGERVRLYDFQQAGHPNYAIGVEPDNIWVGTDENAGQTGFKWYGNTTQAAIMRSNGTLQVSNTVAAKVIKANGTGTAIDASSGNVLTNQVTGTKFNFLAGANTISVDATNATANYTFRLPATSGVGGQVLVTDGSGVTSWSSDPYTLANTIYAEANTASTDAVNAYGQANAARSQANTAYGQANAAYDQANTAYGQANTSYGQANAAYGQANTAYDQANAAYGRANTAYSRADLAYAKANAAYETANDKIQNINGLGAIDISSGATNNVITYSINVARANTTTVGVTRLIDSTSSVDTANAATANAVNAVWEYASTKLPLSGGTISGDLTISGNLYLSENTTLINVSTYQVEDPLIYLASNNDISDTVDIGFMGGKNTSGTYSHTGLIRHAADQKYYLFDGLADEGHQNNVINVAATYMATLRANIEGDSILLAGNTVATQANLTIANDQANAAYGQANAAYGAANTANTNALNAYDQANTATTNAGNAYDQANAAYGQANTAYGQANVAYGQANDAYARANTKVSKSGDTMNGALTITTSGWGLTVGNTIISHELSVGSLNVTTNTVTTIASGQVVLDTFHTAELRSAKYFVQVLSSGDLHTTEVILVQDATNVWTTEYGSIYTAAPLGSFSADIDSGNVRLLFNATNNDNTITAVRYGIQ